MADSSLSSFLAERGLDPANFTAILARFGDKMELQDKRGTTTWKEVLKDIKVFGDANAVLTSFTYYSGWPGMRRTTETRIFKLNKEKSVFVWEDVYVDGQHLTQANDQYDRAFTEILDVRLEDNRAVVQVKGIHNNYEIVCY